MQHDLELKVTSINNVPLFAIKSNTDISHKAIKILGAEQIKGKDYQGWVFPAYYPFGKSVIDEIKFMFPTIGLDPSVKKHIEYLNKCEKVLESYKKLLEKFTFKTTPMDHQVQGLAYLLTFLRLGVFWECGVGKTKLAVDGVRVLKKNTLFLCPSRLVENILDEFRIHAFPGELIVRGVLGKWSKTKKMQEIQEWLDDMNQRSPDDKIPRVYVIGYETAANYKKAKEDPETGEITEVKGDQYFDLLSQLQYDILICDESHKLRSIKSNTSNIVSKLATKASRRILMTGTPSLGNPLHLYVQMRILMPWRYTNYFAFKNKFVVTSKHNRNIVIGFKNLHIIRGQVDSFSIQKTKEECLDLPERSVINKYIDMDLSQAVMYDEIKEGLHTSVEYNPMGALIQTKLHQVCGGTLVESPIDKGICDGCPSLPRCVEFQYTAFSKNCIKKDIERPVKNIILPKNPKLDYLLELLDTLVEGEGKKVILWYKYSNEHKIITESLKKKKIKYVDYGSMGHDAVKEFQENKAPMVFISQIQSSSGITLTEATYTIYYSLTFDLEHYLQSRDRMYRKGQTKKTIEYHLIMRDTIDELLSRALQKKMQVNEALLRQDLQKQVISYLNAR